jgi:DNA-directed RNA polymerase subunit F
MVNPEILSEEPISMVELKEEIEKIKKRDNELNFRVGKTEEYLTHFKTLSKSKHDELIKKIEKLDIPRLKNIHIKKIADLMPESIDDLKVILQGYTLTISNENVKKIVDVVNEFIEKKK